MSSPSTSCSTTPPPSVEQQPGPLVAAHCCAWLDGSAGGEPVIWRNNVTNEQVQPVAAADDLEEEGENLPGLALRLLHSAPHGGDTIVNGALVLLEAHHFPENHGHVLPDGRCHVLHLATSASVVAASLDVVSEVGLAVQERCMCELPLALV